MIPKVTAANRKRKSLWISKKAIIAIKAKHKVFSKYKRPKHPACVRADKLAKKEIEKARKKFEHKLANNIKNDCKSFYAYARSKSKSKVRVGPIINRTGVPSSSDYEMCEIFNDYFVSVFTTEDLATIPTPKLEWQGSDSSSLQDIELNSEIVARKLVSLRADKATGADDLNPRYLKEVQEEMVNPLLYISRKSMDEGV